MSTNNLLKTSLVLTLIAAGGRVLGAALQVLIAGTYGVSADLDAFFVAYSIPNMIGEWFLMAAPAVAMVPIVAKLKIKNSRVEETAFVGSFLTLITAAIACFTVAYFVFTPQIIWLLAPGLEPSQSHLAVVLGRYLVLSLVMVAAIGVARGVLQANNQFVGPALSQVIITGTVIGAILLATRYLKLLAIPAGFLVGSFLALVTLLFLVRQSDLDLRPVWPNSPHLGSAFNLLTSFLLIGLSAQIMFLTDRYFASILPAGSISILEYAEKFQIIFTGIVGMAVAQPVYVSLADASAARSPARIKENVVKGIKFIAFLTVPMWAGFMLFHRAAIKLLFERGSFTAENTAAVSQVMPYLGAAFLVLAFAQLLALTFFALDDTKWMLGTMTVVIALNAALNAWLFRLFGVGGIALSTSIANLLGNGFLWFILHRKLGGFDSRDILSFGLKIMLASGVMTACLALSGRYFDLSAMSGLSLLLALFLHAVAGLIIYFMLCYLLQVEELRKIRL